MQVVNVKISGLVFGIIIVMISGKHVMQARRPLPPAECNLDLCSCTSGAPMCARNLTGVYFQYPSCLEACFQSCCRRYEAPCDVQHGRCMVPVFAEIILDPFNGTVGLIEACPSLYFAAITSRNPELNSV